MQTDGKILAGGYFANIGGQMRGGIARLDATSGAADSFDPSADGGLNSIAVQVDGRKIRTVESLASAENITERKNSIGNVEEARPSTEAMSVLQAAFWEHQGLQCGFCTPGILMTMDAFLHQNPDPTREQVREALSGHICRCTGYHDIVDSVMAAAEVNRSLAKEGASSRDLLRRAYIAE